MDSSDTALLTYIGLQLTKAFSTGKSLGVDETREAMQHDGFFVWLKSSVELDLSTYSFETQQSVLNAFRLLSGINSEIDTWKDGVTMLVGYCFIGLGVEKV